jgi:hypothetical protein
VQGRHASSEKVAKMPTHHTRLRQICAPMLVAGDTASTRSHSTTTSGALTPAQREEFREAGFLVLPDALSATETAKYRALAAALVDRARALDGPSGDSTAGYSFSLESFEGAPVAGFLHKVQGVNTCEAAFNEIARHPSILPKVPFSTPRNHFFCSAGQFRTRIPY